MADEAFCYLCGKTITEDRSKDHVPPKQFYSHEIRRRFPTALLTLPAHGDCNKSYKLDEEYFVHSLAPTARGSFTADSILKDMGDRFRKGHQILLGQTVLKEFDFKPSGLVLPGGKIAKRFDGKRVKRILWKIIRGLYFHEFKTLLPESRSFSFEVVSPGYPPSDIFLLLGDTPRRGHHKAVFDYTYATIGSVTLKADVHVWGLLFWDRLICLGFFHDPSCECKACKPQATQVELGER
jgi:hypothetical protein